MPGTKGNFLFENHTDGAITNASAQHRAAGHKPVTVTYSPESMPKGEVSDTSKNFYTDGSTLDHWDVSFINKDGELRTASITCGYESGDSPDTCKIYFHDDDFSVDMPESSNCTNKSYDQT